ncbi:hypothetical protein [Streptomyces sp. NRRL B-3648]|uniref:hypothetical protein n=1 Tax=Streptomyces sp. NRRL B-3648 TaxID=1519493 RepID=UPI0006B016AC|nr:hypothetical protein [Streptomyces sp. NRRL B-3648]
MTAYCRKSGELAAVVVDALCGPQVSVERLRLVGRVPSELTERLHGHAEDRGMVPAVSVEGDAVVEQLGLLVRAQRAGDILLSRPFFAAGFQDWAHTLHDCVPADEWAVR